MEKNKLQHLLKEISNPDEQQEDRLKLLQVEYDVLEIKARVSELEALIKNRKGGVAPEKRPFKA